MKNITLQRKDGTILSATVDDAVCELFVHLLNRPHDQRPPAHRYIDTTSSLYINLGNKEEPVGA